MIINDLAHQNNIEYPEKSNQRTGNGAQREKQVS